ncbi:hypothetical protein D8M04_08935 [Oceanobacillus piezotolerans]|uniref:IDEAL domain-containing protein n=1 Tax=Oceanobacillus piezotolerans TaxID=2448030 RepID=A0A498D5N9_9BACI|nr:hypothetical protein [Oceanobacillus piezotolerans]RLL44989.1 hypothetical protein D8M04_08935 [Oceanobacillus piezotolerans]
MKKEKLVYRFIRYDGETLTAKREIPYEFSLVAQLVLDELCYRWNKRKLMEEINNTFVKKDRSAFNYYSNLYKEYVWE